MLVNGPLKLCGAAVLCMSLFSAPASARDDEGRFAIKGVGVASCGQFVREAPRNSRAYEAFLNWIDGYTTATNAFAPQTFDVASWESADLIGEVIRTNCERQLDEQFAIVAARVIAQIAETRVTSASDLVPVKSDGESILIYKSTLMKVQERLTEQGLYAGYVDGNYREGTRNALTAFQELEGLPPSGIPDQVTLWKLFRPGM